jgi:hypothetical protein
MGAEAIRRFEPPADHPGKRWRARRRQQRTRAAERIGPRADQRRREAAVAACASSWSPRSSSPRQAAKNESWRRQRSGRLQKYLLQPERQVQIIGDRARQPIHLYGEKCRSAPASKSGRVAVDRARRRPSRQMTDAALCGAVGRPRQRRHDRVPPRRDGGVLLHRDEYPDPEHPVTGMVTGTI